MLSHINEIAPWEADPARVPPRGVARTFRVGPSGEELSSELSPLNGEISMDGAGRAGRAGRKGG